MLCILAVPFMMVVQVLTSWWTKGRSMSLQVPIYTGRQTYRQTGRQKDKHTDRQKDRHTDRQKDGQAGRQAGKQAGSKK